MNLYLSNPDYELGELIPINQLGIADDEIEMLEQQGLETVSRLEGSFVDLLGKAILNDIMKNGEPQIIIIASTSLRPEDVEKLVMRIEARIHNIRLQVVTSGDCTSLHQAIYAGIGYVRADLCSEVLIATGDKTQSAPHSQIIAPFSGGVVGDAVATCRVGREPRGYRILTNPFSVKDTKLLVSNSSRLTASLQCLRSLIKVILRDQSKKNGIIQVIPNTHTNGMRDLISLASGIPPDRVFLGNVSRTGHCFSADNIINLTDWSRKSRPASGQILMVSSGSFQWSGFCLGSPETTR